MIRTTIYTGTPTLSVRDNRNQVVRTLNYNRRDIRQLAEVLIERQLTSDDGRHSQQWDARLFDLWQNDDTVSPNLHTRPSLAGQALRSDSVDAGWCVALYDAAGRIVWAEDGRGTRSRTEFDQLGRPRAAYLQVGEEVERVAERCIYGDTDGSMPDPSSYNARGQLVRHYHDAGLQAAPSYSLQGAALREQCQLLPSAEALSDWQGENESAWQDELAPQVYTTTHEYDALGGALAQTDARGNLQRWSYDVAGLLSQSFLTLSGGSEQILLKQQSWSAAGQKLQETAGNDVATSYSYEPQTQRLVRIETRRADLSVLQDLSYGYDPVGNVIWQENAVVTTRYFANQAVKARNDFQYDALYQLMSASGRENANAGIQGPALPEAMPDTSNLVNYTRSYAYDDGGNLLRIQHTGALSYSNEIVVGSRSNRALAQDSNSPITPEQIDDYFDANGNVLRMQPGTPLGWNERNQLQRVVLVDRGTEQDNDREVYQYRQGLRVRKQMRRLLDATSQRWDIDEVIYLPGLELRSRYAELAGQPQAPSEELHVATPAQGGRAQVRVLHWVAGKPTDITNDQVRYGLGDQIGSLQLELDSSGLVISQEEYYPFGGTAVLAARSATEVAYKVVRYSGKERDGTGLYYYGYRYYAPWLGRWLNPDPAGQVDGLNVYRMVRNNPVTLFDHQGFAPIYTVQGFLDVDMVEDDSEFQIRLAGAVLAANQETFMDVDVQSDNGISYGYSVEVENDYIMFGTVGTPVGSIFSASMLEPAISESIIAESYSLSAPLPNPSTLERDSISPWMSVEYSSHNPSAIQDGSFPFIREKFKQSVYRVDKNDFEHIKEKGFSASEDFGAVENLLGEQSALIVSESIDGIKIYVEQGGGYGHLYAIDTNNILGVSLNENFERFRERTENIMFSDPQSSDSPLKMMEAHLDLLQLNDEIKKPGILTYIGEVNKFNINGYMKYTQ